MEAWFRNVSIGTEAVRRLVIRFLCFKGYLVKGGLTYCLPDLETNTVMNDEPILFLLGH